MTRLPHLEPVETERRPPLYGEVPTLTRVAALRRLLARAPADPPWWTRLWGRLLEWRDGWRG